MRRPLLLLLVLAAPAAAQVDDPRTVFPTAAPRPAERLEVPVTLTLETSLLSDFVYRGIEVAEPTGGEDGPILALAGRATFDTGGGPRPYLSLLGHVAEDDGSSLQLLWPTLGVAFDTAAGEIELGHTTFFYPDRDELETNELFARWQAPRREMATPAGTVAFRPSLLLAWDYDGYDGAWAEAKLAAERAFEGIGLTLRGEAGVGAASGLAEFYGSESAGLVAYELALGADYRLNTLLNIPRNRGTFALTARLSYTDGLDADFDTASELAARFGLTWTR